VDPSCILQSGVETASFFKRTTINLLGPGIQATSGLIPFGIGHFLSRPVFLYQATAFIFLHLIENQRRNYIRTLALSRIGDHF
jgi:hypothetical protein